MFFNKFLKKNKDKTFTNGNIYDIIEKENKEIKIRNYVEQMTLNELTQLLPSDIFAKIPKKRKLIEDEVVKLVLNNEIEFKNNNSSYYIDSDKILKNDKDYYIENFKERQNDIKIFESIKKDKLINMGFLNNIIIDDRDY